MLRAVRTAKKVFCCFDAIERVALLATARLKALVEGLARVAVPAGAHDRPLRVEVELRVLLLRQTVVVRIQILEPRRLLFGQCY